MKKVFFSVFLLLLVSVSFSTNLGNYRTLIEDVFRGKINDTNCNGRPDMGDALLILKSMNIPNKTAEDIPIPSWLADVDVSFFVKDGNVVVEAGKYGTYSAKVSGGHIKRAYSGRKGKCDYIVSVDEEFISAHAGTNETIENVLKDGIIKGAVRMKGCSLSSKLKSAFMNAGLAFGGLLARII